MRFRETISKIINKHDEDKKYKQNITQLEKEIIILKEKIRLHEEARKLERERIIRDLRDIKCIY